MDRIMIFAEMCGSGLGACWNVRQLACQNADMLGSDFNCTVFTLSCPTPIVITNSAFRMCPISSSRIPIGDGNDRQTYSHA